MLRQGPANEAKLIQEKTGAATVAALDGMIMNFQENITVQLGKGKSQQALVDFF
jgi:hypothetical protein